MAAKDVKRKRSAKTSFAQYEEYLKAMEEDPIFRTGTINPTVDPQYINKKWENLTQKLNSIGSGPELMVLEWKKRFTDWRNATRAKYRKIVEHSKQTGGGPATELILSPLEDRGLTVWGKVTVAGSPKVLVVGGLQDWQLKPKETDTKDRENRGENSNRPSSPESPSYEPLLNTSLESDELTTEVPDVRLPKPSETQPGTSGKDTSVTSRQSVHIPVKMSLFEKIKRKKQKVSEQRPLPAISEEFLSLYKENVTTETTNFLLEERKFKLETNKFKFEVAKYKFENPDFEFEIEEM